MAVADDITPLGLDLLVVTFIVVVVALAVTEIGYFNKRRPRNDDTRRRDRPSVTILIATMVSSAVGAATLWVFSGPIVVAVLPWSFYVYYWCFRGRTR